MTTMNFLTDLDFKSVAKDDDSVAAAMLNEMREFIIDSLATCRGKGVEPGKIHFKASLVVENDGFTKKLDKLGKMSI